MKRILTFSLLMALCLSLGAQNDIVRLLAENPDRATNNMHSYEFDPIVDTPAPKGFKPFYISHYGRHGSRYEQNSTFARNAQGAFAVLDSLGLLTETGKALRDDVEAVVEAHKGMEGSLTPRGAREHRMLAARMFERGEIHELHQPQPACPQAERARGPASVVPRRHAAGRPPAAAAAALRSLPRHPRL